MTEREFDIQLRKLLQDAQEPVSPAVWEAVAAGLGRRRRAAAFRLWGTVASVAAAAAVALFVFLKPSAPVLEPDVISMVMSQASGEAEHPRNTPRLAVAEPAPAAVPAARRKAPVAAPAPMAPAVAAPAAAAPAPKAPEAAETAPAVAPVPVTEAQAPVASAPDVQTEEANAALNRLAFEAEKSAPKKEFALAAFGNFQTSQRAGIQGVYRRYGAPLLGKQDGVYNESPEVSFSLPFSLGLGFRWILSDQWSLGSGIRYTNMRRTFVGNYKGEGFYLEQTDIDNTQHWLGVPLNVYYHIIDKGRWRVHAFGGGGVEWLMDNHYLIHSNPSDIHYHQARNGIPQLSAGAGLGFEFRISPLIGLYLDPSFRYFFDTQKQPRSLRTVQPLRFDIEAGVRFSFGR